MRIRSLLLKHPLIATLLLAVTALIAFLTLREAPLEARAQTDTIVVDGTTRSYRIVIPHDTPTPAPIVFAFHGMGDSTESMAAYSGLDRLAAGNGFILVYPAGQDSRWAVNHVDPAMLDANPDVRFFDQLLGHLATLHEIDRDRVYLMGMSNGASFVHLLAAARSDQVAACVAHSGPRPQNLEAGDTPVPVMLVVGADDFVASVVESDADRYRELGYSVQFITVSGLGHAWSTRHNGEMWEFLQLRTRRTGAGAEQRD